MSHITMIGFPGTTTFKSRETKSLQMTEGRDTTRCMTVLLDKLFRKKCLRLTSLKIGHCVRLSCYGYFKHGVSIPFAHKRIDKKANDCDKEY